MNPDAMLPFGLALIDYFKGESQAEILVRRDDGLAAPLPAGIFFRTPDQFTPLEQLALEHCSGSVLDVGAGSGLHSLVLQETGLPVTAIDISPQAVEIMQQRGVRDTRRADVLEFEGGPYDTLLLLGHGIGMVEDLEGLDQFLRHAHRLVREGGQILLDSLDVTRSDEPRNRAYHAANRGAGRYVGQTRIRFEYKNLIGPECGWLHVDPGTLARHAKQAGWICTTLLESPHGEHLTSVRSELHH